MSKQKGALGEEVAREYLSKSGYRVIANNYSSRFGEIDVIALENDCIVFTEVKLRKNKSMVTGRESVTFSKIRRIIKTALMYLSEQKLSDTLNARFDVVEITCSKNCGCLSRDNIVHIKNAFTLNDFYQEAA